ncbi:aminomethyltransferase, putative [Trypanosoma brucei gambiense DAL972]|uniref:Aminomethyltransferase n=1 Tax=Trypanosoma brucei gambiense (strain MHOM/CI/86/DAL972) TaxID=679716 RepID=D0A8G6_TRYB9|nr:aminomethyltransferase, putative [Trypanosoma brucei gambiense DAL972]CBH17967.1 aminomethyltransferase, putative [Trypanosoma brucei gambiense DAL972]|eukprot:XP_011780231.1 aminomethyltransferase, putative [Trypanosoma brucei gambiense DAL972]
MSTSLRHTALHAFHVGRRARMAPFSGYDMPINYAAGAVREHLHTREAASIFDVSHFGVVEVFGADREKFLEWLTPSAPSRLPSGKAALTMFLNDRAGVKDDCIVTRYDDRLVVVVNAGCKDKMIAYMRQSVADFTGDVALEMEDRAIVTVQGPKAASALAPHVEDLDKLLFMQGRQDVDIRGMRIKTLTRCSYSGEDGFDIVMREEDALPIVELLLQNPDVQAAGLAARDTLRTEAGLNLYSHELSEDIDPVAARCMWCVPKHRMTEGGFVGHERLAQLVKKAKELVPRVRVGILAAPERGPIPRNGTPVLVEGKCVGVVTSGVPSPTLGRNIALGYVDRSYSNIGQQVGLDVRGKLVKAEIVNSRFVAPRYYRG